MLSAHQCFHSERHVTEEAVHDIIGLEQSERHLRRVRSQLIDPCDNVVEAGRGCNNLCYTCIHSMYLSLVQLPDQHWLVRRCANTKPATDAANGSRIGICKA